MFCLCDVLKSIIYGADGAADVVLGRTSCRNERNNSTMMTVAVSDVHHYISPSASKAIDSQTIIM